MRKATISVFNSYINKIISNRYSRNHAVAYGDYSIIRKYLIDSNNKLLFEDEKHLELISEYKKSGYRKNKRHRTDPDLREEIFEFYDENIKINYKFIDTIIKYVEDLNNYLNKLNPQVYIDRTCNSKIIYRIEYIVKDLNGYNNAITEIKKNLKTIIEYTWIYLRYYKRIPTAKLKKFKVTNISMSKTFVLVIEMEEIKE